MPQNVLFLDKDETLGEWHPGNGFYRGSKGFLRSQHKKGRELHILTTAGDAGKVDVSDISNLLSGYIGADQNKFKIWFLYPR